MVCPRRLSFSPFVVLVSTTNGEKDNLIGQTVRQELGEILAGLVFFSSPFRVYKAGSQPKIVIEHLIP